MNCLNCTTKLTTIQMTYCSIDCMRDYANKIRNLHNKYSKEIKEANREFSEKIDQLNANERYLGRY